MLDKDHLLSHFTFLATGLFISTQNQVNLIAASTSQTGMKLKLYEHSNLKSLITNNTIL